MLTGKKMIVLSMDYGAARDAKVLVICVVTKKFFYLQPQVHCFDLFFCTIAHRDLVEYCSFLRSITVSYHPIEAR